MKRLTLVVGAALAAAASLAFAAPSASTAHVCVGNQPRCFATLQEALDAAHDGDTIHIGRGTFAGGASIDVSVRVAGAGAGRTIISGGGPVLTIGSFGAETEPTVSIDGVTITGGITRSGPESVPFTDQEGVLAAGGGIAIPPNADFSGGATVTIADSVIAGNRVAPSATIPAFDCPECDFSLAGGGGISNWGALTLRNTVVKDNRIGSASGLSTLTSDAEGGAILNWNGPLTIRDSVIDGNRASATAPNGRFAEGGALMMFGGTLTLTNSAVMGNHAVLASSKPNGVNQVANGGGLHIGGDGSAATIRNTTISDNAVTMTNTVGDANAFSAGIHVDFGVDFQMTGSVLADNDVVSETLPGSAGDALGDSGAGELHGTIENTRFTGNTATVSSAAGNVKAGGGASILFGTITNSVVRDNHVRASSPNGSVSAAGGALIVEDGLGLRNTRVSRNTVEASGVSGSAQGGGIFDAPIPDGPQGGPLVLVNSEVTRNVLIGGSGITLQGGGLYIVDQPLSLRNSVIARNIPDQCFGC